MLAATEELVLDCGDGVRLQAFHRDYAWGGSESFDLVAGGLREGAVADMRG